MVLCGHSLVVGIAECHCDQVIFIEIRHGVPEVEVDASRVLCVGIHLEGGATFAAEAQCLEQFVRLFDHNRLLSGRRGSVGCTGRFNALGCPNAAHRRETQGLDDN